MCACFHNNYFNSIYKCPGNVGGISGSSLRHPGHNIYVLRGQSPQRGYQAGSQATVCPSCEQYHCVTAKVHHLLAELLLERLLGKRGHGDSR